MKPPRSLVFDRIQLSVFSGGKPLKDRDLLIDLSTPSPSVLFKENSYSDENNKNKQWKYESFSLFYFCYTHSLVSDQVVFNGGAAIILLDPVDLKTIAPVLDFDF